MRRRRRKRTGRNMQVCYTYFSLVSKAALAIIIPILYVRKWRLSGVIWLVQLLQIISDKTNLNKTWFQNMLFFIFIILQRFYSHQTWIVAEKQDITKPLIKEQYTIDLHFSMALENISIHYIYNSNLRAFKVPEASEC